MDDTTHAAARAPLSGRCLQCPNTAAASAHRLTNLTQKLRWRSNQTVFVQGRGRSISPGWNFGPERHRWDAGWPINWCECRESNPDQWLRRPLHYPLCYTRATDRRFRRPTADCRAQRQGVADRVSSHRECNCRVIAKTPVRFPAPILPLWPWLAVSRRFLQAGVMAEGAGTPTRERTPQDGPLWLPREASVGLVVPRCGAPLVCPAWVKSRTFEANPPVSERSPTGVSKMSQSIAPT